MEYIVSIKKKKGKDIGIKNGIHPKDLEEGHYPRVGKEGYDKKLKFEDILNIAYTINEPRPNIIIKNGKGKWYIKHSELDRLDESVNKTKGWRNVKNAIMYIIIWE
jgi:hypothetical protein